MPLYPLKFDPAFKDYTWGGRKLAELLGRDLPEGKIAESWEISAHPNGRTPVLAGPLAGTYLDDLQRNHGEALVGSRNRDALARDRFPLLIKLLDANEWLSVQVHPRDNEVADDLGKTEMWVVLQGDPGSELILGLESETDQGTLRTALESGRLTEHLHRVPARAGDVFFVPAGTVHAIGPGLLLAEIQQSSDTTYRLYDWGRSGEDRALHLEEGLAALDLGAVRPGAVQPELRHEREIEIERLASCRYFATDRIAIPAGAALTGECDGETLEIVGIVEGRAALSSSAGSLELEAVEWCLLPADLGSYEIRAESATRLLRVATPQAP